MAHEIQLVFSAGTKKVPIKTIVTRALLRDTASAMSVLRDVSQNMALTEVILKNANVLKYVTITGSLSTSFEAELRDEVLRSNPSLTGDQLQAEIQKLAGAKLNEEFPEVMLAILNPQSEIDTSSDAAVLAAIGLIKIIIDQSQLTETEKAEIATADVIDTKDGEEVGRSNAFWDNQDVKEVVSAANYFRGLVQRRDRTYSRY